MPNNEICTTCNYSPECNKTGMLCPAVKGLIKIYEQTRNTDRYQLIKKYGRMLGIVDAEPSKELRKLAEAIIDSFSHLHFIREYGIRIGYVMSQEKPPVSGGKVKYADCRKVKLNYQAWLPFDFIITFYQPNTETRTENQQKIIMLHELEHIGIGRDGLKLEDHDVEDFRNILKKYGLNWNDFDVDVPDILSEDNILLNENKYI